MACETLTGPVTAFTPGVVLVPAARLVTSVSLFAPHDPPAPWAEQLDEPLLARVPFTSPAAWPVVAAVAVPEQPLVWQSTCPLAWLVADQPAAAPSPERTAPSIEPIERTARSFDVALLAWESQSPPRVAQLAEPVVARVTGFLPPTLIDAAVLVEPLPEQPDAAQSTWVPVWAPSRALAPEEVSQPPPDTEQVAVPDAARVVMLVWVLALAGVLPAVLAGFLVTVVVARWVRSPVVELALPEQPRPPSQFTDARAVGSVRVSPNQPPSPARWTSVEVPHPAAPAAQCAALVALADSPARALLVLPVVGAPVRPVDEPAHEPLAAWQSPPASVWVA